MLQAENFHGKDWFIANDSVHGHDGLLDIEPHDLASGQAEDYSLQSLTMLGSYLKHDLGFHGGSGFTTSSRHVLDW